MNPYLDPQNNPHVKVKLLLSSLVTVDCLIDTGFSGGIALPESFLVSFKQKPVGYREYELADGSFTTFAVYKTKVKYKSVSKEITLIFTKSDEGLVGIEFLQGKKFVLDLKKFTVNLG